MNQKQNKRPLLEEGLLLAMNALDNQVAREMQRSPKDVESQGVQKWEPLEKRIELVTAFILDSLGDQEAQLDSVLILSQAFSKALQLLTEDLGEQGLGKIRSAYCLSAFKNIQSNCFRGEQVLRGSSEVN